MATNSLQSLNHHHHSLPRRHSIDTTLSSVFLKPTTKSSTITSLSQSLSFIPQSLSSSSSPSSTTTTTTTPSTSKVTSIDLLKEHLSSQNFREADEVTRRLLIALAGEAAQKRGYVFFSEVQFIAESDLKTIDELWKQHSNGRFGYSVQKKVWKKVKRDFSRFFIKVGWMKKLDTEIEQYNYRSFPGEFVWVLEDDTPEGHLPLTNALRGTQLLNSILTHPAFEDGESDDEDEDERESGLGGGLGGLKGIGSKPLSSSSKTGGGGGGFKPDYSF